MFGVRFIKVQPTTYLLQYKEGKIKRQGLGLAFYYYAPTTNLVAVPVASNDAPFMFSETTADFQEVSLQGQVTYRVGDPVKVSTLLNFTLDASGYRHVSDDPEKLPERVGNLVRVLARKQIETLPMRQALRASDRIVTNLRADLASSPEIAALGLEIIGLSILAIKPTPESARALEAGARESLLKEADEALYARRNASIEQERSIKENELATELAVELKKRQIRDAEIDTERSVLEKRNALRASELEAADHPGRPEQGSGGHQQRKPAGGSGDARLWADGGDEGVRGRGTEHGASAGERGDEARATHRRGVPRDGRTRRQDRGAEPVAGPAAGTAGGRRQRGGRCDRNPPPGSRPKHPRRRIGKRPCRG